MVLLRPRRRTPMRSRTPATSCKRHPTTPATRQPIRLCRRSKHIGADSKSATTKCRRRSSTSLPVQKSPATLSTWTRPPLTTCSNNKPMAQSPRIFSSARSPKTARCSRLISLSRPSKFCTQNCSKMPTRSTPASVPRTSIRSTSLTQDPRDRQLRRPRPSSTTLRIIAVRPQLSSRKR